MVQTKGTDGDVYETKKEMLIGESQKVLQNYSTAITLRQLYYRLVSQNLVENKQSQYQYLSKAVKEARLNGRIRWSSIEDRTRDFQGGDRSRIEPETRLKWAVEELKDSPDNHVLPRWMGQDNYVEVWFEKEALSSLFGRACGPLNVVYYPSRGYSSITQLHEAATRIKEQDVPGDKIVLYFGDFDPSGEDIERDIAQKLAITFGVNVKTKRIALNRELIDEYELPPQPAKTTDARYDDFVKKHGDEVVELDALEPDVLKELVRESVSEYYDEEYYEENVKPKEEEEQEQLREWIDEEREQLREWIDGVMEE